MPSPSSGPTTRRRFIRIAALQTAAWLGATRGSSLLAASKSSDLIQWKGIVLGAEATIQLHAPNRKDATRVLAHSVSEIQRLESVFSLYDGRSTLSILNRDKAYRNPPRELVRLLETALHFCETTRGAFDVTVHPVVEAYRNHFRAGGNGEPPDLERILAAVGPQRLSVSESEIRLTHPRSALTLNGIAQGFITDRIADFLRQAGFGHTLLDLGETRALDSHPSGRPWKLGLANGQGIHDVVPLSNQALSASGGYGTTFDEAGKFHHLIDPRSGLPVSHHRSVHVLAETATAADALSTALATCGPDETGMILRRYPKAKAFFS